MPILLPGEEVDAHRITLMRSGKGWIQLQLDGSTIFHMFEEDGESHVYQQNIQRVFPNAPICKVRVPE